MNFAYCLPQAPEIASADWASRPQCHTKQPRHKEAVSLSSQIIRWLCDEPEALAELYDRSASASGS
ncbi:MAG: hypothetical protein ABL921_17535, partial [Pirellula sp.]